MALTPFLAAAAALFVATLSLAKSDHPLDRITPVPATEQIPILDFFRPPLFTSPQLNKAGTHFAALYSDNEDRTHLLVVDLATLKTDALISRKNTDVHQFHWLGDKHLFLRLTKEKQYALGMSVAEVGHLSNSYLVEAYNALTVVGIPQKNPMHPIVWLHHDAWDNGKDRGALQIDARKALKPIRDGIGGLHTGDNPNGTTASVVTVYDAPKGGTPAGYLADHEGELAYAYTEKAGIFTLHRLTPTGWTVCPIDLDEIDILDVSDVPGQLIVTGLRVEGKPLALYRMDASTGQLGELLYQDERYDTNNARLYRKPGTNKIIGLQFPRTATHSVWFDEEYRALQKKITASFPIPNTLLRIIGSDLAEKRFVVATINDRTPVAFYQVDLEKGQIGLIKSTAPWIDPARMRPMQTMTYKTRDGFRIEGYLTLPDGASKENPAPLVVLPHGGPQVRDVWGFDPEVQFLASRGYAVFQPNYRGSTSYQWQFPERARWEFRRMHDDVTDGVKALLKTGLLDAHRIAIMGSSFGGYLAISGAAHEKDFYRCAVTIAGIFDWEQVVRESKNHDYFRSEYNILRRQLGDPEKQREFFESVSPLRFISQVKIPVFVSHGKEDLVAQVSQSKRLVSELEKHGVPYEKRFVSGEGHGFSYYKNRIEVYGAIEAFLAKHLAPLPQPASP